MAIPTTPQGVLNRIRASVTFFGFPELNVTSPYLAKRGISFTFTGKSTVMLDTMTGRVTSPEPYLGITMMVHLVKSQYLANLWRLQQETTTLLGDCVVRPDASTLQPYGFVNMAITSAGSPADFSGADADFPVEIEGTYLINAALYL
jgi:hypothetical protein